jgi:NAD(P)-dependent dehydrogenase (short-subunit alcohol dehydrogenase family)
VSHKDKVAIVIGASSGIGRAIACILADEGCDVVCAARSKANLEDTARMVEERGRKALVIPTDVRDGEAIKALVATTLDTFKKIDVLVYSSGGPVAGVTSFKAPDSQDAFFEGMAKLSIGQVSEPDWNSIFEINFLGGKRAIEAVLPHMKAVDRGNIIVVTSKGGRMQEMIVPGMVPYATSKAAISRFVEGVGFELMCEGSDVKINAFSPGMIAVSMHDKFPKEELEAWGKPEDVKDVVLKILNDSESGEIYEAEGLQTWADEFRAK